MKISVITVTKNNKEGLVRAIECVRNQTYKNVEHIIVDGASTDGTVEILRSAQDDTKKSSLLTTHYSLLTISEADSGIYDAINKGIKLATGDVIGLLHSDDLYADENVIMKYAEAFARPFTLNQGESKQIDAVYSDLVYVKKKLEPDSESESGMTNQSTNYSLLTTNYSIIRYWKTGDPSTPLRMTKWLKNGWMPPHPTLFIRKNVYAKFGLYRSDMQIAADYEMILRLFYKQKITAYYLPLTTYLMSIGGASNKSPGNIIKKSKEDFHAMKLNGIPFPVMTLLSKNLRKLPQFLARDL